MEDFLTFLLEEAVSAEVVLEASAVEVLVAVEQVEAGSKNRHKILDLRF